MKHLYYIRHGQSVANAQDHWGGQLDTPLTELGIQQAKETALKAKQQGLSFDVIVSSPLSRAHDTAKQVAQATGYPINDIITHDQFVERSFGILEDTESPEAVKLYLQDEALIDPIQDVERLVDLQWRAQKALDYLQNLPHDTILVVGHGAYGRALWRAINKQPLHELGTRMANAEITKLI